MLVFAAVSLAILLAEIALVDDDDPRSTAASLLAYADIVIMLLFAAEVVYRISLVPSAPRLWYVLANPIDVLIVLVAGAQPLRLLRSARALRAFRAVRVATILAKGSREYVHAGTCDRLVYGVKIVIIAVAAGAYAFAFFVGSDTDRFNDLPDAFWWSVATTTSLGLGIALDEAGSRVVAVLLTVVGLIVVEGLAGTLGAFFVESDRAASPEAADAGETAGQARRGTVLPSDVSRERATRSIGERSTAVPRARRWRPRQSPDESRGGRRPPCTGRRCPAAVARRRVVGSAPTFVTATHGARLP